MSMTIAIAVACIALALLILVCIVGLVLIDERRREKIRLSENPFGDRPLPPSYCSCVEMKPACDCNALERAARRSWA